MFKQIMEYIIFPLISILISFIISYINQKKNEIIAKTDNTKVAKYTNLLADIVSKCVLATQQTYVDTLKKEGAFDKEAQKIAFDNTYQAVLNILSDEVIEYLEELYGDYSNYITQLIEAEVNANKKK